MKICNRSRQSGYCRSLAQTRTKQGWSCDAVCHPVAFSSDWVVGERSCWVWLGHHSQTINFLCLKVFVHKKEKKCQLVRLVAHFIILWQGLCCRRFPSKDLIKVFCVLVELVHTRHSVWYIHMAMSYFTTRDFSLNTLSLKSVLHLNYLSGSSGCRCPCPPYSHPSIKGIFKFAGNWFLWEQPCLRLTITNLSDPMF